jgi:hypothetical protein
MKIIQVHRNLGIWIFFSKKKSLKYIITGLFLSCMVILRGQDIPFSPPYKKHLTIKEGLPSNTVYSVTKTIDGYWYISTRNGVVRYYGGNMNAEGNLQGVLPGGVTFRVFPDMLGRHWFSTWQPQVSYLQNDQLFTAENKPFLKKLKNPKTFGDIYADPMGFVFFIFGIEHTYIVSGENVHAISELFGNDFFRKISNGLIYRIIYVEPLTYNLVTDRGIFRVKMNKKYGLEADTLTRFVPSDHIDFTHLETDRLLYISNQELIDYTISSGNKKVVCKNEEFFQKNITFLYRAENVYFVGTRNGLFIMDGIHDTKILDGLFVYNIVSDNMYVWVSTNEGVFIYEREVLTMDGISINPLYGKIIRSKYAGDDKFISLTNKGMILFHTSREILKWAMLPDWKNYSEVCNILDMGDYMIIPTQEYFYRVDKQGFRIHPAERHFYGSIKSITAKKGADHFFIGTIHGILKIYTSKQQEETIFSVSGYESFISMLETKDGIYLLSYHSLYFQDLQGTTSKLFESDKCTFTSLKKIGDYILLLTNGCNPYIAEMAGGKFTAHPFSISGAKMNYCEELNDSIAVLISDNQLSLFDYRKKFLVKSIKFEERIVEMGKYPGGIYVAFDHTFITYPDNKLQIPSMDKATPGFKITSINDFRNKHYTEHEKIVLGYGNKKLLIKTNVINPYDYPNSLVYHLKRDQVTIAEGRLSEDEPLNLYISTFGNYKLELAMIDPADGGFLESKDLYFRVKKPFYFTYAFLISALIFLLALVFGYLKYREYKIKKEKAFEYELVVNKLKALTVGMNPHFIFNVLVGIKNLANNQEYELIKNYVDKFSSVARYNLNSLRSNFTNLEKEVILIKSYLDLEKMRFPELFEYEIYMDPMIEEQNCKIPVSVLQPVLENCLIHGIIPKKKDGKIKVEFIEDEENNILTILVSDNGVGYNPEKISMHKTDNNQIAMDTIQSRIASINQVTDLSCSMTIEAIIKDGVPQGTLVTFSFPLYYDWRSLDTSPF